MNKNIRLTEKQQYLIKKIVKEVLGNKVKIFIFGSRADISKKGGDIDLLVKCSEELNNEKKFEAKMKIITKLYKELGDRKIDLLIFNKPKNDLEKITLKEAIEL